MNTLKQIVLRAGLGQAYYEFWWRYRCPFDPLPKQQIDKGYYFVHIPKTAGTSVLSALDVAHTPYTHCPAHVIRRLHPEASKRLFHFSVVRDPYARFASSFYYISQRSDWAAQRRFGEDVIGDLTFVEFTQKLARNRGFRNLIMGYEFFFPQTYYTHQSNRPLVDTLLRFETLTEDFDRLIRTRFPDVGALPVLRDHGGGDYQKVYDAASREVVRSLYASDFELLGYPT